MGGRGRVPSGRNLGPWEVLEQGRSMWESVLGGWLGQDADFERPQST